MNDTKGGKVMADVSKVQVEQVQYNLKDAAARTQLGTLQNQVDGLYTITEISIENEALKLGYVIRSAGVPITFTVSGVSLLIE